MGIRHSGAPQAGGAAKVMPSPTDVRLPQEIGELSTAGRRHTELQVSATYTRASR
eukprot:CAMPEP_0177211318 /NCGR_PEP_ID=MMETSP0367-20130122/32031_1 /TAXON_ID=447022 ORGANISM="Scrippsiella hangoei-like, Strain SHHI-4" /NCGR_SAMPLE_ID=MMETSP0367 /ASSEMBLY_ACC=CAM_ASM_000362 /LENGTH=54 /DNA_ID=CAMNT_0018660501 /DNA_START=47 /DNA_END=207 /DNA_ORIENTATION=-